MKDSKSPPSYVASHLRNVPRSGIRDFFEIVSSRDDVISLSIGEPDAVTPWHIREQAIYSLERGSTSYTPNLGLLELRRAVSDYVGEGFGVRYDPTNEILVTVGVSEGLDLAIRAIVEPGDEVIYHEPCYVSYAAEIAFARGCPVPITTRQEDDFRLTGAQVAEKVTGRTKALLLNFPTNPTGAVLRREDVASIAEVAISHDLVVIADEIYSELTYDGERLSIAAIPGMKERTIFLNGFSKAWAMTGFRVGFACAPPELTEAMMKIHQYTMLCAPILSQKAGIEAIRNGSRDVQEMRSEYRKRRNFIHASLNGMGIPCHLPGGAFYAFPCIRDFGMTSRDFALRLLNEEKVACVPGTAFGPPGEGYIRCAYSTAMPELREAMARMARFVAKLKQD